MNKHKVRPIVTVETNSPKIIYTYLAGYGETISANTYSWFIEGPKEKILIDTGAKAEKFHQLGWPSKESSPEEGLSKFGVTCEDIDLVIVTHLDFDHIELAHKYPKAKFIVQKKELDSGLNPHPSYKWRYNRSLFEDLDFEIVEGDKEIVAGVRVLLTPGHSMGTQSVAVETDRGTEIIAGFCCVRDTFESTENAKEVMARMFPIISPGIHVNYMQVYDSVNRIMKEADVILPLHEAKL